MLISPVSGPGPADADLADASAAGDPEAWEEILERYHELIWDLAYGVLRRRSDAEDVVRATFLEAVDTIEGIPDPITLRPWLLSITGRHAVAYADRVEAPPDAPHPGDAVPAERLALVAAAFDSLSGQDRAALEFADRHKLKDAELAACLWLTRDRAHVLVDDARVRFEEAVAILAGLCHGLSECPRLVSLVDGDSPAAALDRRRVRRHLTRCDVCAVPRDPYLDARTLVVQLPIVEMEDRVAAQTRAATVEAASGFALGPSGEGIWFDRPGRRSRSERRRRR